MVRLKGQMICVTPQELAAIEDNVAAHSALTLAEGGCLVFEITQSDDPMIWDVLESFRDMADFNAHQARTRDSHWFAATRSIARNYRVEEVGD